MGRRSWCSSEAPIDIFWGCSNSVKCSFGYELCINTPVKSCFIPGSQPTFWEFITAVLETGLVNEHWRPITESCSLCAKDLVYDVILKFENLNPEQDFFARVLGIRGPRSPEHQSRRPLTEAERLAYFDMLDEEETQKLYQYYKMDFELFEYDWRNFGWKRKRGATRRILSTVVLSRYFAYLQKESRKINDNLVWYPKLAECYESLRTW